MYSFSEAVDKGLSGSPKQISSRFFYDEVGSKLFTEIMDLPEYYLTRAELEIFQTQSKNIIECLNLSPHETFELIELGAGDGTKTKELIRELLTEQYVFEYLPIDISQHALDNLGNSLKTTFPDLKIKPQHGEYFGVLDAIKQSHHRKVVLFLGSNLGNMQDPVAHDFIYQLGSSLLVDDQVFIGLDMIKSADIVLPAYNDAQQITSKFNLNLLTRINRELGGDFDILQFEHHPEYNEEEGVAKSSLVSKTDQTIEIKALDKRVNFKKGEKIHTEISRKYNDEILKKILENTDFTIAGKFKDSKNYFADYILKRN